MNMEPTTSMAMPAMSMMDHADHGGHGGHDMPMGPKCSMNMLWNAQIEDTCIVFRQWHISTKTAFALSCIAVALIGIAYEYLRLLQGAVDLRIALILSRGKARSVNQSPDSEHAESAGLLSGSNSSGQVEIPTIARVVRAVLYGISVFVSFFLMLVFMTYNAYLILSVVLGAAIGHFLFNPKINVDAILAGASSHKGMACH